MWRLLLYARPVTHAEQLTQLTPDQEVHSTHGTYYTSSCKSEYLWPLNCCQGYWSQLGTPLLPLFQVMGLPLHSDQLILTTASPCPNQSCDYLPRWSVVWKRYTSYQGPINNMAIVQILMDHPCSPTSVDFRYYWELWLPLKNQLKKIPNRCLGGSVN